MRVPHFLTLLFGLVAMTALFGCSRESSVKENVNLRNNHSRIFAFKEPIEDPQAFADSMANMPVNETDSIPDTLTVTVNDTVYLIGLLPYNVDKIYRFQWVLAKGNTDTTIVTYNATPQKWVFTKDSIYYPLFIAFDGNNTTDTAGSATKKTFIRVIDTKPSLSVPKDTLWTRHDGDITFPIVASDSFGSIASIMVDLDASGKKDSAKVWKYETREDNDSLYITIKNDSTKIDKLGNQKIYVIATDDDGNQTKDSVNLHFNRLPRLKVIYPQDGARHNIDDRFYFYYESEDDDNPQDLKYFIRAQVSTNGQPPQKAFTDNDLIVANFTSNIFEPRDSQDSNYITLLKDPSTRLTGRIYWDMYVKDGYDEVYIDRIKTSDNLSRPWNFYIGNLSSSQGTFTGVAKYQGRDDHSGIRVEFSKDNRIFEAITDSKGNFRADVDSGTYTVKASSNSLKEYTTVTLKDKLFIESGATIKIEPIELKDTVKPVLIVKNFDTLTVRKFNQTVYARDLGSFIDTLNATVDGKTEPLTCSVSDGGAVYNCIFSMSDMADGTHTLYYTVKDKAGNEDSLKQDIVINATKIDLDVNGDKNARIGEGESFEFTARVTDAVPAPKKVQWTWDLDDTKTSTDVDENGVATITYTYEQLKTLAIAGKDYIMTVSYTENGANVNTQVKFGILGDDPSIIFTEPAFDDTVSLNDPVAFKIKTYPGKASTSMVVKWNCPNSDKLATGYSCPADDTKEANLAYKAVSTYTVTVTVKDQDDKTGSASTKVIVISDPPTINATTDSKTNEYKINSTVTVKASASDKYGTINHIKWGCSNGMVVFDNDTAFTTPANSVSDVPLKIQLPSAEVSNFRCIFKAIDDDGEEGQDTLIFKTILDLPTVRLATKTDVVTINSKQLIKAIATDQLGVITKYEYACSDKLSELKTPEWTQMSKAQDSVAMPSTPTNAYYCVVQVTDDDNNLARDTTTYKVIAGLPSVTAIVDYNRVTIKDTVDLNAFARDTLNGYIVKYEWGCGPATSVNVQYTYVSEKKGSTQATPHTKMAMPSEAHDGYKCLIRVTDNDNNSVLDSVKIDIIQAPPTVEVANKTLVARENLSMVLKASAHDNNNLPSDPGSIVKREWSCGTPNQIISNWTTVSDFDTIWTAPAQQTTYYCIARATDNDGNQASDTIRISFTNEIPTIEVANELIYVNPGDRFELDAAVNSAWQGIDWFTWECIDKETKQTMEPKVIQYSYAGNHGTLKIGKDSTYSEKGKDMLCIISARETSSQDVLSDTSEVRIIKYHPTGVISAADTVYLWSGDESVEDEAKYFYTTDWNGKNSIGGELKDPDHNYEYWWNFSNVDGNFYQGRTDGSIDTAIRQINPAFIRSNYEGSMTIKLDFIDSIGPHTQAFYSRHRAEIASHTVYFRKAWKNLVKETKDTVIAQTEASTSPVMIIHNNKPTVAYVDNSNNAVVTSYTNGAWNTLGTITGATAPISALQLVTDGSNLYLGILENSGKYSLYKSFTKIGSTLENVKQAKVLIKSGTTSPTLMYLAADKKVYLAELNGSSWKNNTTFANLKNTFTRTTNGGHHQQQETYSVKYNEFDATFSSSGKLVIVAVVDSSSNTGYKFVYSSSYENKNAEKIEDDMSRITLLESSNTIYMGFENRNQDKYGPYVYKGTLSDNTLSFNKDGIFGKPIIEGPMAAHISLVQSNNILYAAFDDRDKASNAQVHVYKFVDNQWRLYGENQLPYFAAAFYKANQYYLRGYSPMLATDDNGSIYVSMRALESAYDEEQHTVKNNGPIVMKYVADNWEIK